MGSANDTYFETEEVACSAYREDRIGGRIDRRPYDASADDHYWLLDGWRMEPHTFRTHGITLLRWLLGACGRPGRSSNGWPLSLSGSHAWGWQWRHGPRGPAGRAILPAARPATAFLPSSPTFFFFFYFFSVWRLWIEEN